MHIYMHVCIYAYIYTLLHGILSYGILQKNVQRFVLDKVLCNLDMCPGLLPKVNLYLSFFNYYMTKIPF